MTTRMILPKSEKPERKRIAAYCRVSSFSEEQLHSYAAQIKYYTETLTVDESCELVGVYADEGISGTSAKKRLRFMEMIEDCRAGKIDAILTKSVSRFGRNTVDTLVYTRELKALGIDVYFEKENLHSISPDGELLLTLMAAFAESESQSLSENISWGFRKRYAEGDLNSIPMHNVYGFDRNIDGDIVIREDEARKTPLCRCSGLGAVMRLRRTAQIDFLSHSKKFCDLIFPSLHFVFSRFCLSSLSFLRWGSLTGKCPDAIFKWNFKKRHYLVRDRFVPNGVEKG